jgi:hypothetical protein
VQCSAVQRSELKCSIQYRELPGAATRWQGRACACACPFAEQDPDAKLALLLNLHSGDYRC